MNRRQAETVVLLRREVLLEVEHWTEDDGTVYVAGWDDGCRMVATLNDEGVCNWI